MPEDRDDEIVRLQQQLAEVLAAEEFEKSEAGRLWIQLATAEINKAVADITSNKYDKDHMGYLARKSDLNCYKNMLKRMQLAGSPVRKQKIVEAIGTDEENAGTDS
jgi:hypothetical protein